MELSDCYFDTNSLLIADIYGPKADLMRVGWINQTMHSFLFCFYNIINTICLHKMHMASLNFNCITFCYITRIYLAKFTEEQKQLVYKLRVDSQNVHAPVLSL